MNDFLSEVFNPDAAWSWLLTLIGVTGFYFAGKKKWWCWYINIANQAFWVAYSLITEQWGFLLGCLIYSWVFGKNAVEWTRAYRNLKLEKQLIDKVYGNPVIGNIINVWDSDEGISIKAQLNDDGIQILEMSEPKINVQESLHFYPPGYCWQIVDGLLCGKEECDEVHMVKDGHDFLREAPYIRPVQD